jgi:SAM-dependent methyltransferase
VKPPPVQKLLDLIPPALDRQTFVKLTLSAPKGPDRTLKNIHVRAIELRGVPHLSFVYHHATHDITKNFTPAEGVALLHEIVGIQFRNAHLFTTTGTAQLEVRDGRPARFRHRPPQHASAPSREHDTARQRLLAKDCPWLEDLGVTTASGRVVAGMEAKFRQMNKFVEVFASLANDAQLLALPALSIADMGCGKGYLTFALFDWLRSQRSDRLRICGIEARLELVQQANQIAKQHRLAGLTFVPGQIADAQPEDRFDVLIALHACDTATDDAIARGIQSEARLILVSPCCHKEVRPQLVSPAILAGALRHGILRERHAEFITDALRAGLLEWAGYETRVFEFISTEHTAKNLMIAALRRTDSREKAPGIPPADPSTKTGETQDAAANRVRALAVEYGIRHQRLAQQLGFSLT